MTRLGEFLTLLRKRTGRSALDVLKEAGLHKATETRWRTGERQPHLHDVARLLHVLKATDADCLYVLRLAAEDWKPKKYPQRRRSGFAPRSSTQAG